MGGVTLGTWNKFGGVTLLFLPGLGFGMAIAAKCKAAPATNFVDRLIAVQPALQSRKEPPVDARELAEAIAAIPKVSPTWAAMVLTIAAHESGLRARIARSDCRPAECDGGRAWGLYQSHKNTRNAEAWGSPDLRLQTLEAAAALRSAFYQCGGLKSADWPLQTIRAYAGHGCGSPLRGEAERVATFERLRGRL